MRIARTVRTVLAAVGCMLLLDCTGSSPKGSESVLDIKPGQCFTAPPHVKAELSTLARTSCSSPHTHESYAVLAYTTASGAKTDTYPGSDALTTFAQGHCAQQFSPYVGVSYLASKYYFTFLLPSVRSWEEDDDHAVVCFVISTGGSLNSSVRGVKK